MRILILLLAACASGFAATVGTSATCNGITVSGIYSANCSNGYHSGLASAEAQVSDSVPILGVAAPVVETSVSIGSPIPGGGGPFSAKAAAFFVADYVLTVTGEAAAAYSCLSSPELLITVISHM